MKLNRKWLLVIALVLSLAMTTAGTLAFLTDRDSEVNTFTVGNVSIDLEENFDEDSKLLPGSQSSNAVKKETFIKNTGDNDAWVWMTMAIPAALDNATTTTVGEANALHWNVPGVVWKGYHSNPAAGKIQTALDNGWITADHLNAASNAVKDDCVWTICQKDTDPVAIKQENIDGVEYNVYTFLYNGILAPNAKTPVALHQVYLDSKIDVDPDGNWYLVNNGEATNLNWNNSNEIKVIVSAYAIQAEGFDSVEDAYKAYNDQWGSNGTEYDGGDEEEPTLPTTNWEVSAVTDWYTEDTAATEYEIGTAEELAGLAQIVNNYEKDGTYDFPFNGKTVTLTADIDLAGKIWTPIGKVNDTEHAFWGTFDGNGHTISNLYATGENGVGLFGAIFYGGDFGRGKATIKDVTVDTATIIANEYAGVIVGHSYGNLNNCTAKNATITATEEAGSIVGSTPSDAAPIEVTGNNAENVTITATEHAGAILGRAFSSVCNYENNSWDNVTINGVAATDAVGSLNK